MIEDNADTFHEVAASTAIHRQAAAILRKYRHHAFSYVDAVLFNIADRDPMVSRILTVDGGDFRSYRFAHTVDVITPP